MPQPSRHFPTQTLEKILQGVPPVRRGGATKLGGYGSLAAHATRGCSCPAVQSHSGNPTTELCGYPAEFIGPGRPHPRGGAARRAGVRRPSKARSSVGGRRCCDGRARRILNQTKCGLVVTPPRTRKGAAGAIHTGSGAKLGARRAAPWSSEINAMSALGE